MNLHCAGRIGVHPIVDLTRILRALGHDGRTPSSLLGRARLVINPSENEVSPDETLNTVRLERALLALDHLRLRAKTRSVVKGETAIDLTAPNNHGRLVVDPIGLKDIEEELVEALALRPIDCGGRRIG
jgi:hypothetical protein